MDYSKITDNPEVIKLLKQRIELENKIKAIDENALIKHEIELLALPDVVKSFYCDDESECNLSRCETQYRVCRGVEQTLPKQ
jgi:hypothetical protein